MILEPECFNGAVASQPRKDGGRVSTWRDKSGLQWGRGFAATEGNRLPAAAMTAALLQWGRGFAATEGESRYASVDAGRTASMGPWLRSHGRGRVGGGEVAVRHRFNGAVASQPRKVTTGREV